MKAREYALISRAVEEGAQNGWHRSHKHVEQPSEELVISAMCDAIMLALCEVFVFEDGE